MDKKVIPLVNFFNSYGLKTCMSCSGHFHLDGRQSLFWIEFDETTVTEKDLEDFWNKVRPMNGWLVKRLIPGPKYNIYRWCYVAGSYRAAKADLKRWKHIT